MRVHFITHAAFEGPARIAAWAIDRGHVQSEGLALTERYPAPAEVELLVIMGGPMAADDHAGNPWLAAEKRFIASVIEAGGSVLGVCLGSQILAEVAGGRVKRASEPEIGWYPVTRTSAAAADPVFCDFPDGLVVGHWHGDTFDLPNGAMTLLSSRVCANQAFSLADGRLVGLQCHLEWSTEALGAMLEACGPELAVFGDSVAGPAALLAGAAAHGEGCRVALWGILDRMASLRESQP
jgi:GMP synthase-like glutamine amidotransferase